MATNHFERKRREQERILAGLERRYDKGGASLRQFTKDLAAIQQLVTDKVIDPSHGDLLRARAEAKYQEAEATKKFAKFLVKRGVQTDRIALYITVFIGLFALLFFFALIS